MAFKWIKTGRWMIRPTRFRKVLVVWLEESLEVVIPGDMGTTFEHRWRRAKLDELDIDMQGRVGT